MVRGKGGLKRPVVRPRRAVKGSPGSKKKSVGRLKKELRLRKVGDAVYVKTKGWTQHYLGEITAVNSSGTYAIRFTDGDYKEAVKPSEIWVGQGAPPILGSTRHIYRPGNWSNCAWWVRVDKDSLKEFKALRKELKPCLPADDDVASDSCSGGSSSSRTSDSDDSDDGSSSDQSVASDTSSAMAAV
jgi:hypothetical protein